LLFVEDLDEIRWRAIEARSAAADTLFVYGVRTTGVFCRPGCSSRRPLRRNVEYFVTPEDAAAGGYRACRKCRPSESRERDAASGAVRHWCRALEAPAAHVDAVALARDVGYSERHLRRLFREIVGVTPSAYARAAAAQRVRAALREGRSVTEAVHGAGYGSARAFYEDAAPRLGMTPQRFRDGGRGETIRYTTVETPLDVVALGSTSRGLCGVVIERDEDAALARLFEEFPLATVVRDDEGLAAEALVLARALEGGADASVLPLDVQATAFQARVWEALRSIPAGETRSYSQVAASIGQPSAVRAVASACASNPVAITVPCHRVVRSDGSLGGYRWGLETKRLLLKSEERTIA
jgi:AraC family transcriptional regulator, regulatory protein of adaptative response / methylated-DNA-[protein]-cysteine methyltransferase